MTFTLVLSPERGEEIFLWWWKSCKIMIDFRFYFLHLSSTPRFLRFDLRNHYRGKTWLKKLISVVTI